MDARQEIGGERDLIVELRKAADQIAVVGQSGWGNTCLDAADKLATHNTEKQEAALKHIALFGELQNALEEIAGLREALEKIESWMLPETGEVWPSGNPVRYESAYGSNGARDYMRTVARAALTQQPPKD